MRVLALLLLLLVPAVLAPTPSGSAASSSRRLEDADGDPPAQRRFLSWLAEGGASIHPSLRVRAAVATGVRGLHTNDPLGVGTELAVVPRRLWLDDSTAAASGVGPLLKEIKKQATRLPQHTSLLIFLVHERLLGAKSFWASYFDWLPQAYTDLPENWPDHRRNALLTRLPSGITEWVAHEHWSYAETEFDLLKRIVFEPKPEFFPHRDPATLRAAYDWAYGTIHSRGHSGQGAAGTSVDGVELFAVIPFLDTANHANAAAGVDGDMAQVPVSAAENGGEAAIRLSANRPYGAGDELHVAYDNITGCHSKMLSMYGFSERDPHGAKGKRHSILRSFNMGNAHLPRQARDKHEGKSFRTWRFSLFP
jgi:hypothetical protein